MNAHDWLRPLLERARGVGLERGFDIVLDAIFATWVSALPDTRMAEECWMLLDRIRYESFDGVASSASTVPKSDRDARFETDAREYVERHTRGIPEELRRQELRGAFEWAMREGARLDPRESSATTPPDVAALLAAVLPSSVGSVFDPAAGTGSLLVEAARRFPKASISGIELGRRAARRAEMRLRMAGASQRGPLVAHGDALIRRDSEPHDAVLMQPPWGLRAEPHEGDYYSQISASLFGNFIELKGVTSDLRWLLLAAASLSRRGRAAVVLPASSASRGSDIPRLLAEQGWVSAVCALPTGTFAHTRVETVVWILERPDTSISDSVLFMDADSSGQLSEGWPEHAAKVLTNWLDRRLVEVDDYIAVVRPRGEVLDRNDFDPLSYLDARPEKESRHPEPEQALLTGLELSGFKAFGDALGIPLRPITLLYGANSAGKSSIIQSLLLLKQSLASPYLVTQGANANVGSFRGASHGHYGRPMSFGLSYGALPSWLSNGGAIDPSLERKVRLRFADAGDGRGHVEEFFVAAGGLSTALTRSHSLASNYETSLEALESALELLARQPLYRVAAKKGVAPPAAEPKSTSVRDGSRTAVRVLMRMEQRSLEMSSDGLLPSGTPLLPPATARREDRSLGVASAYLRRYGQLIGSVSDEVSALLRSIVWLGPLRSAPKRLYDRAVDTDASSDGRHIAVHLFDHESVLESVNEWLRRLEVPYQLTVGSVGGEQADLIGDLVVLGLIDTRTGVEVSPVDVGYGVSQLLPIVVELASRRESIVAIEQPETHLHPRLQARLGDLLIETTSAGASGNQVLVETHSEHLLLRLQRRIREGSLEADSVCVLYVDRQASGDVIVKRLELDEFGEFVDEWPQGFFDDRLDELIGGI